MIPVKTSKLEPLFGHVVTMAAAFSFSARGGNDVTRLANELGVVCDEIECRCAANADSLIHKARRMSTKSSRSVI
jgi:hypothetical protein